MVRAGQRKASSVLPVGVLRQAPYRGSVTPRVQHAFLESSLERFLMATGGSGVSFPEQAEQGGFMWTSL